ncbi:hypothetical protein NUU61_000029 [Penicillium alfredii]|uniref:Glucosamine 6-phosphate N-acetyltransferase n=1 Tax=Penicillium alfredii TaxID=1506179 RepID=A0A9W9KQ88_9EURO|nr:uncharacterized protein NUU61_000029 [Penicillium alfredii]KAJ5114270.1 hypothetical protein NUU61_000029 [Penicillium alfredii]
MTSNTILTTKIQPPPGPNAKLVLPATNSHTATNPTIFNDAMAVRMPVFVNEQHCSADAEIDDDDARSWHWVLYDSSGTRTTPVGVIRLVPPPQPPYARVAHPEAAEDLPEYDWAHEPCIKLTRVAVLPAYRGKGLGRRLVETALEWAGTHAAEIDAAAAERAASAGRTDPPPHWRGLVLVHAQVEVERMYTGLGFQTDQALGRWHEEGIEHVGMFRRMAVP